MKLKKKKSIEAYYELQLDSYESEKEPELLATLRGDAKKVYLAGSNSTLPMLANVMKDAYQLYREAITDWPLK